MKILTILLTCTLVTISLADDAASDDLEIGTINKLLNMANFETPQSLKNVQISNETRIERQAAISTSPEPFLLSEANFHEYVIDSETHEMILD